MANVPLFNDGQSRPAPRGPKQARMPDKSGSISTASLDTRGVSQAMLQASQQPTIPLNAFQGDAIAGEAWGNALQNIGAVIGKVAEDRMQAKNYADLADAEGYMNTQLSEFEKEKQANINNPDSWGGLWQKKFQGIQKTIETNKNYSPFVRERLRNHLVRWGSSAAINIEGDATQATFARAKQSSEANFLSAIDAGDLEGARRAKQVQVDMGLIVPEKANYDLTQGGKQIQEQNHEVFVNRLNLATANMDEEGAKTLIKTSGLRDDEKDIYLADTLSKIGQQRARVDTKLKNDRIDGYRYAIAKDGVLSIDPLAIDQDVKDGKLDVGAAAGLRETLRNAQGVQENPQANGYDYLPHLKMEELITDAQNYDPDDDPNGKTWGELSQRALSLGMSQIQHARFAAELDEAKANNADATGKSASAEKTWVRNQIQYSVEQQAGQFKTSVWNAELESHLTDKKKLMEIGIGKDAAEDIVKVARSDKSAALNLLRKAGPTMADPSSSPKGTFKTEKEKTDAIYYYGVLKRATASDADGMILDEQAKLNGDFLGIKLLKEFDGWYKAQPEKPTVEKMRSWINDRSKAKFQGGTNSFFINPKGQSKTVSQVIDEGSTSRYSVLDDGSFQGIASSYGYSGDADNGFNSIGMKRGTQPYFGTHPTIALAPSVAKKMGLKLPQKTDDGAWDLSHSKLEVEGQDGKKITAIYDENGMYIDARSKNKLIDLTPEASVALGLPVGSNASNIKIRKRTEKS